MNIELTKGCVYGSITIDDKEEINLSDKERAKIKEHICKWICREDVSLNELLRVLVSHYHDEYKCDDEPCECCGDYVETYKWNI